jgi:subtilisin family serine protease
VRVPPVGAPGPIESIRPVRSEPNPSPVSERANLATGNPGTGNPGTGNPGTGNPGNGGIVVPQIGGRPVGGGGNGVPPANERRYVLDEVVVELAGTLSDQAFNTMAARYRLRRLETQPIALTNSTWVRWHIADLRSVPVVVRALSTDRSVRWVQPNYLFSAEQGDAPKGEANGQTLDEKPADANRDEGAGDPAQYALAKLHLIEAQALARGDRVVVAVVDTEIDKTSPELAGTIADSFDAVGVPTPMEAHGTGIAGIIAAHARLLGAAPAVRLLAVRALGRGQGTTFSIIKGLDWAVAQNARVINMSFAGPVDPAIGRVMAASYDKGCVLVAAVGNKGPKSPPLYPAADPHVIAVTATDSHDKLFALANRGQHVAIAAPGVDILVAAPDDAYLMSSGTSMASAYASGVVALLLGRKPDLTPDAVKRIIMSTAHALGPKGRDDQFGAGLIDANSAILAVEGRPAAELQAPPTQ